MTIVINKKDARLFDREWRIQKLYPIRKEDKTLGPLELNEIQQKLFDYAKSLNFRGIRDVEPKARKEGVSTFWLLFYLDDTLWTPNTTTAILAHRREDVQKLFKIVKLAYNLCPKKIKLSDGRVWVKPEAKYDNKNELEFEGINSRIYVGLEVRGDTPNNLHLSEAAYMKEDRIRASMASVPNITFGSNITVESTANGIGGWFHETCIESEGGIGNYHLNFFPWFAVKKHNIPAPSDFAPTQEEMNMAKRIKEHYGVDLNNDQLFWYHCTKTEQKRQMDQDFPCFLDEAFLMSGSLAFDREAINKINTLPPIREWQGLKIWAEPRPNRMYICAVDPAEGVGGDSSVIEIYDQLTLEQVAEFASDKIKPADLAKPVDKYCRLYNNALAVVERNNHGHTVLDRLKDIYPNIYFTEVSDEKTRRRTKKLGWETNSHTRDLVLDNMDELLTIMTRIVKSAILKSELLTFVLNEDGRREAKSGKHDDTILASAIALHIARMPRRTFGIYSLK